MICGCSSSQIKEPEKPKPFEKQPFEYYEQTFYEGDTAARLGVLKDLWKIQSGEYAIILVKGLFDQNPEIRRKSLEVLESYRSWTLQDLDQHFYQHLDRWFNKYPLSILKQLNYHKEYQNFINTLEESGQRSDFYKKKPLQFLLDSGKLWSVLKQLRNQSQRGLKVFWIVWLVGDLQLAKGFSYLLEFLSKGDAIGTLEPEPNPSLDTELPDHSFESWPEYAWSKRFVVLWALSKYRKKHWLPLASTSVLSDNPYEQEISTLSVGSLQDTRFTELFTRLMEEDAPWISKHLRAGILWSLGQLKEESVLFLLDNPLSQGDAKGFHWDKVQALWVLKRFGFKSIPPWLLDNLEETSLLMQTTIFLLIDKLNDQSKASKLYQILKNSIAKEKSQQKKTRPQVRTAETQVNQTLKKKRRVLVQKVLKTLTQWGQANSVNPILTLLNTQTFRDLGIIALGDLGYDKKGVVSLKLLERLLAKGTPPKHQVLMIQALQKLGYPGVFEKILTFYESIFEKKDLKKQIKQAQNKKDPLPDKKSTYNIKKELMPLWKILHRFADLKKLLGLIDNPNPTFKLAVIQVFLHNMPQIKNLAFLNKLLKDKDVRVKIGAVKLVGLFGYGRAKNLLLNFINTTKNKELIRVSILSLGKLKIQMGMGQVIDFINSSDEKLHFSAIKALGYSADPRWYPTLSQYYSSARSVKEKMGALLSMFLLGKVSLKHTDDWINILKEPIHDSLKPFVQDYFEEMGKKKKQAFIKSILSQLNPIQTLWFEEYMKDLEHFIKKAKEKQKDSP